MITNKHLSRIIVAITTVAVLVCFVAMCYANELTELLGGLGVNMEYESELFDTSEIISVNILMDEDEWNEMLSNAMSEQYYICDVIVNGQRFYDVAIRPKGNTSLSAIAMDPDSDRFSLKLEFDRNVAGQTCFGLDKLILNNNYADATNMKEALIYDMYQYLGADASLYNYASVSVNDNYWGVYLALEAVEDSFMLRNYGTQDGEIYKPETMGMGGNDNNGDGGFSFGDMDFSNVDFSNMPDMSNFDPSNMPDMSDFDFSQFGGMTPPSGDDSNGMPQRPGSNDSDTGGGFSSGGSGGANLNYTDDDLDSYSTIWEGAITSVNTADKRRVVTALEHIATGEDIETYLDVDNVLKYMAVHVFSVNMDSLSANMAHNYYLYEYDGQLNIFPWDYNLSLGGMGMGGTNASDTINDAIDTPFDGTDFFNVLLENEEYSKIYHDYLQQLVDEYVNGGGFDEFYNRTMEQISELVKTDPTAFYTYDEFTNASGILYEVVKLRAESIDGQLEGTIPSTDAGQRLNDSALIDCSGIDITAMGQFSMGGFSNESFGGDSDSNEETEVPQRPDSGSGTPDMSNFDPSSMGTPDNTGSFSGMPGGAMGFGTAKIKTAISYVVYFVIMIVALLIVKNIKRRK